jgi:plasmid stabilization system protein ParE
MSLKVAFRRAAQDELSEAAAWYENRQPGLGEAFLNELAEAIDHAARHPEQHPIALRDVRRALLRRFPYAVYYRIRNQSLVVLAVFHARRKPIVWKRRL